jgi:putative inorganic carbon (hco3(-)) transporter
MKNWLRLTTNVLALFLALISLLGLYYWYGDISLVSQIALLFSGSVLAIGLLFYSTKWFYVLLVAVIPISLNIGLDSGAQLNFPSEGMLVLMLPFLLLFNKEYRQGLLRIATHPISILLAIGLFIEIISAILGTHIDVSLKRVTLRLVFIFGFYGIIHSFKSPKTLTYPWIAYAVGLFPVMIITLRNHWSYNFNPRVVFSICQPYFNEHTVYGACLAFLLPFITMVLLNRKQFKWKPFVLVLWFILFVLVVVSEFLALSRASILSIGVALLFYGLLQLKISFKVVVFGMLIFGAGLWHFSDELYEKSRVSKAVSNDGQISNHFSSVTNLNTDASNLERVNRWICAYRMFETKPWLGYGPGTYQFEYNQHQTLANKTYISTNFGDKGNAHSEYLMYLSESGILGFVTFLLLVFVSMYCGMESHYFLNDSLLKSLNLSLLLGLITFYFHGLFNSFIDQSKMGFLFYTALGIVAAIHQKVRKMKKEIA